MEASATVAHRKLTQKGRKMLEWVFVMVFPVTQQMGYKYHKTEKECYATAVEAATKAKEMKVKLGWKCFKRDDPAYSAIMRQIREHEMKDSI